MSLQHRSNGNDARIVFLKSRCDSPLTREATPAMVNVKQIAAGETQILGKRVRSASLFAAEFHASRVLFCEFDLRQRSGPFASAHLLRASQADQFGFIAFKR
jgi:hypothetical protein